MLATITASIAINGVIVDDDAEPSSVSLAQRWLARQLAQHQRLSRLLRGVHLTRRVDGKGNIIEGGGEREVDKGERETGWCKGGKIVYRKICRSGFYPPWRRICRIWEKK